MNIGKESTYDTPVAGSYAIPCIDEDLTFANQPIRSLTVESRALSMSIGGPKKVTGGWSQYVNYKNVGLILKALLGDENKTNPTAGVALHTFTHNALGSLPSITARVGLHDVTEKIVSGYGVDQLDLECQPDEFLKIKVKGIGANETTGTVGSPTFNTQAYAVLTNTFTLAGSAATPESFKLSIKNNLKSNHHTITSRTLPRIETGALEISGAMSIRFLNTTHLTNFLNGTQVKLIAKWQGGVISGGYNYYLQVTVDSIEYDAGDAYVDKQERIVEDLKFTGVKVGTDIVKIELQNDEDVTY